MAKSLPRGRARQTRKRQHPPSSENRKATKGRLENEKTHLLSLSLSLSPMWTPRGEVRRRSAFPSIVSLLSRDGPSSRDSSTTLSQIPKASNIARGNGPKLERRRRPVLACVLSSLERRRRRTHAAAIFSLKSRGSQRAICHDRSNARSKALFPQHSRSSQSHETTLTPTLKQNQQGILRS